MPRADKPCTSIFGPDESDAKAITAVLLDVVERHRANAPDVDATGLGP